MSKEGRREVTSGSCPGGVECWKDGTREDAARGQGDGKASSLSAPPRSRVGVALSNEPKLEGQCNKAGRAVWRYMYRDRPAERDMEGAEKMLGDWTGRREGPAGGSTLMRGWYKAGGGGPAGAGRTVGPPPRRPCIAPVKLDGCQMGDLAGVPLLGAAPRDQLLCTSTGNMQVDWSRGSI